MVECRNADVPGDAVAGESGSYIMDPYQRSIYSSSRRRRKAVARRRIILGVAALVVIALVVVAVIFLWGGKDDSNGPPRAAATRRPRALRKTTGSDSTGTSARFDGSTDGSGSTIL